MRTLLWSCVLVCVSASTGHAQPNPYCITGADWRPTNSRMVTLGMPGGLGDESGSLGYFWGQFFEWNIPAMTNPCYRLNKPHCYQVDTDTIDDPVATEAWILANPGHIYLMGNEMDNFDLAAGDGMTPEQYARQFRTYATFIKPLDPTARMAVGGLFAMSDTAHVNADIVWWNQVLTYYQSEFGEDMPIDVWNCHCYTAVGNLDPERIVNEFFIPYRTYVDTVSGGIYADKPLWCTEYGVSLWSTPLDPAYMAEFIQQLCPHLEQEYLLPTGQTKRVCDRFFWFLGPYEYTWRDSAMLDQSGQPTILGTTYSQLANSYPNPVPSPPPAPPPPPTVQSDFEVDADPWRVLAGDWPLDAGGYRQTRYNEKWGTAAHLPYWYRHFSIEADVKINQAAATTHWVGFKLRHSTIWSGGLQGYLVYLRQNGEVGISSPVDGSVASVAGVVADTSVYHRLGAMICGSVLKVTVDGQPVIEWYDPNSRRAEGLVSIQTGLTDCSFDNVLVVDLGVDDTDTDGDGAIDVCDNCIDDANPDQADSDGDGLGNACDNCPDNPDPNQDDTDTDSVGDLCDNCPSSPNADQCDLDADGTGDACDPSTPSETALLFDGSDDRAMIPDASALHFGTGDFTAELWFKASDEGFLLDTRADLPPGEVGVYLRIDPEGEVVFALEIPEQQHVETELISSPGFDDGLWHHVAGVREGGEARLYVDGAPQTTAPLILDMNITSGSPVVLGMRHSFEAPFSGVLDELRIWSVARTQQQIADTKNASLTGHEPGLVLYQKFYGICHDQPLADASVCSLDGWLGAAAAWVETTDPAWCVSDAPIAAPIDQDGDNVLDPFDNCPAVPNEDQANSDGDGFGDLCDNCPDDASPDQSDPDLDDVGTPCDNCPDDPNGDQADSDTDGVGTVCDNCPDDPNPGQDNNDGDPDGDVCDDDDDNDGVLDTADNCPLTSNIGQDDADDDEVGDACDACPDTPAGVVVDEVGCPVPIATDFDGDYDVDQADFGHFQACMSGPGIAQSNPACQNVLLDTDDDVDQDDFAIFQACMSGANVPSDPACGG